jgi:hypothetical protein
LKTKCPLKHLYGTKDDGCILSAVEFLQTSKLCTDFFAMKLADEKLEL